MTPVTLLAALLLIVGGAVVLLRSQVRRADVRTRLRAIDGVPSPSPRVIVRAVFATAAILAVPALPVVLAVLGAPAVAVVLAALAVLPMVATIGAELHAGIRRSGLPLRMPLVADWQRRLASALVARAVALLPAPPLRRRRARQRSARPILTSAGTGRRLLVVPPGAPSQRLWDVAETYLGARSRYRDILSLNRDRRSPGGAFITEDSRVLAGWTLLMPRDATGTGLVDLAGDARLPMRPGPAERGFGGVAGASVVLTPPPDPVPDDPEPVEDVAPAVDGVNDAGPVEDQPGDEPAAPLEHPAADLPWDLVHARVLAEGVRTMLLLRRGRREHDRAVGAFVRPLDPAAAAVGTAAELGADRRGAASIDRAVRALPDPPPSVAAARLLPDAVEFVLGVADPSAPAPFTADATGRRWTVQRYADHGAIADPRLPGLVSLGRDRSGWTMLDLTGAVSVITGEVRAARMVATAIGLELVVNRWAAGSRVVMVGFGRTFADTDPRLIVADCVEQVLDDVVRHARESGPAQFVVLAAPPPAAADELLRRLTGPGVAARLGVLVVGGATEGRRVLALDSDGVLTCAQLGIAVGAQALSSATAGALARLVAAESGDEPPPASGAAPAPELPRDVDPDATALTVRLFGDVGLDSPDGPLGADPVTVEIVTFLALRGAATQQEIAQAVFPFGVPDADLRMAVKVVVEVLATVSLGDPGLLEHDDGRLELTADVQADWHLFVRLAESGREPEALELLSRAAAKRTGATHGAPYAWLIGVPITRALPGYVADVAHGQVSRRLAERRADLAAVAATAGLQAQPFSQVLRDDLQRALRALGERGLGS